MSAYKYVGTELEMFAQATNWKTYLWLRMRRFLGPDVLEVGAGLGGTTQALVRQEHRSWICAEPDPKLAGQLQKKIDKAQLPACCAVHIGALDDIPAREAFDTILYVDVLEHIEDDRGEVERAAERLKSEGRLIVLAPAHQWLFTPFDQQVGHFRRYNRHLLQILTPERLVLKRCEYLDSCGLLASLGNRVILNSEMPSLRQVLFWDRVLVRMSRCVDPVIFRSAGKSILAVWQRRG